MSRPAVVYLVMVVVLIAGLWLVLAKGRTLRAPQDLAGKWQLTPIAAGMPAQSLVIEQSGRFFQLLFEHGPAIDLELKSETPSVTLASKNSTVYVIDRGTNPDDRQLVLVGPQSGQWNAHLVERKFPDDVVAKEAK